MRDYGVVSPKFWIGDTGKALRGHMEAQVLALYLMTSPHANAIGVFHCPVLYMAHETGLGMEGASKGLQTLVEGGFCSYDTPSEMVFVKRMAAFQIAEAIKPDDKRAKWLQKEYEKLPEGSLKTEFFATYSVAFGIKSKAANDDHIEAPPKPLASQEQEQEQDQEQKKPTALSAARPPTCPYDSIVALYLELLPELPGVRVMDDDRKKGIRKRWEWVLTTSKPDGARRAESAEQGLEWFRSYFELARDNDFLMGRSKRGAEHGNWKCDIDFLMTTKGLKQVLERTEAA